MAFFDYNLQQKLKQYRFGVYFRRSSRDNEDKQMRSIEGQEQDLKEVINKFGLNVVKFYPPESRTAFKKDRPIFNTILSDAENNIIDALLVWHANRVARNYGDGGDFVQLMSEDKMKILLTPHGYFENTPRDKAYLMGEFTRATEDSDDKSEAVKRGNKTKLKAGHVPNGRLSEGYIHTLNEKYEMINASDPERFPLLKKAVQLVLNQTHMPLEALDVLNNKWGYRTRRTRRGGDTSLSKSTWYKLLSDSKYAGRIERTEGTFNADFPTLYSMNDFEKLQIIIGKNSTRRRTKKEWPFTGEMTCSDCGSHITMDEKWQIICPCCKTKFHVGKETDKCPDCLTLIKNMKNPKLLHYVWLMCTKKKRLKDGSKCKQRVIAIKDFEKQVDDILQLFEIPKEFSQWAIKWLEKMNDKETSDRTLMHKNLQNIYNNVQKQVDSLLDSLIRGLITDEEYKKKKELLLLEKQEVKERLKDSDKRADDWLELSERTFNFSTYARHWFINGDNQQKRAILRTLGTNLVLKDKKLLLLQREPFIVMKKIKEELEKLQQKSEHKEKLIKKLQRDSFETSFPNLLGS